MREGLHSELKSRLAEGFINIGNISLGALIFNQLTQFDSLDLRAIFLGVILGSAFYSFAILLFKGE